MTNPDQSCAAGPQILPHTVHMQTSDVEMVNKIEVDQNGDSMYWYVNN